MGLTLRFIMGTFFGIQKWYAILVEVWCVAAT